MADHSNIDRRWSRLEMLRLAASGAHKCDVGGVRGATLVNTEEVLAMAAVLLVSGVLPSAKELNRVADEETKPQTENVTKTPKAEGDQNG